MLSTLPPLLQVGWHHSSWTGIDHVLNIGPDNWASVFGGIKASSPSLQLLTQKAHAVAHPWPEDTAPPLWEPSPLIQEPFTEGFPDAGGLCSLVCFLQQPLAL